MERKKFYQLNVSITAHTANARYRLNVKALACCFPSALLNVKKEAREDVERVFVKEIKQNPKEYSIREPIEKIDVSIKEKELEYFKIY